MLTRLFSLTALAALLVGCAPRSTPQAAPTLPAAKASPSPALPSPTVPPTTPAVLTMVAPTVQPVVVAAVKGNLYIRRGPDLAFNPIAVLSKGQSRTAKARDVLGDWLQIPVPDESGRLGWISIQTSFSSVSGDVASLPEVQPTEWPAPAFLRNCTFHDLTAEPGGVTLPGLKNFPANDVRMNPGIYRIYDTQVDGYPEILKVELKEGSAIDVIIDGNGLKKKCPEP